MRNSKKPIKFAHLQKLVNQSTLNNSLGMEIIKAFTVTFMKARNFLVVRWTKKERGKKQKMVKMYFLKVLIIVVPGSTKLFLVERL